MLVLEDSTTLTGSSPHTRGALDHGDGGVDQLRDVGGGSSPHTRGAQTIASLGEEKRRIIPAYAGSTAP